MARMVVASDRTIPFPRRIMTQIPLVLLALLVLAFPFLGAAPFVTTLLTEALIFAIWAMSLDLLVGFTGLVTFGHAAGLGLAAYAAGYFALEVTSEFLVAFVVAEIVVLGVAIATGFVATRLSGVAFAIITLAISQVLFQIAVAWRSITQGMDGLIGVPLPTFFGRIVQPGRPFYVLTASLVIVTYLLLRRLVDSPFGRTLQAIRASEERAAAIGINVRLHKWIVFVISWSVAAVAGTLLVFMKAGVTPMTLYWHESGNVLAMTIFGGLGTLLGPITGAIAFVFLRDEFTTLFQSWQFAFGLAFVLAVIFMPTGLAGLVTRVWTWIIRRRS